GMWARGPGVWAGGGQPLAVVHGLSTRPAGRGPTRRARPHIHRAAVSFRTIVLESLVDQTSLFTVALGLVSPWEVTEVAFDPEAGRIDFHVGFQRGARFACPECGAAHQAVHDTRERSWRHLNFFQYQAFVHAKV